MGSLFNKAKSTAQQANGFNDKHYQDNTQVALSGIQFATGIVIEGEDGSPLFIIADGFKDVNFSLNYESNVFKLSKNARLEIALSHQLRLETYLAVKAWGESAAASDEVTVLEIDPEQYPTAGDYYDDPTMRAIFVKLAKGDGAVVADEVVEKGRALFAKTKR